jgi:hypothetical protein
MRLLPLLLLAFGLAACDAGQPDPDPGELAVREVLLTDADGVIVAHSHEDHWHGTLRVPAGGSATLRAYVVPAGAPDTGHDAPPRETWVSLADHPDHMLRVTSDDESVARWTGDRDVLTVSSTAVGAALTTVVVLRGSTTRYQSPPAATIASPPVLAAR